MKLPETFKTWVYVPGGVVETQDVGRILSECGMKFSSAVTTHHLLLKRPLAFSEIQKLRNLLEGKAKVLRFIPRP